MKMNEIVERLKREDVVAYPTEAVFGLGCNPHSESAVNNLLILKNRPVEKGLILIAPDLMFLHPFIDQSLLSHAHLDKLTAHYPHPVTWVVPANPNTPKYLTGRFDRIAVRITDHPAVCALCKNAGFALTSTSANLSGLPPCKTADEVRSQFGKNFPVLDASVGKAQNPSEIRDLLTNQLFRQG